MERTLKQLGVAQPALSRQIRKMEDELGVALILRGGRQFRSAIVHLVGDFGGRP
jgi:DNA-binding transcriptional LysR family regulator